MSRYSRQVIMPQVGPEGQNRLRQARVLLVGLGGLGCPAASYLAAAGIGRLGLVDFDRVSLENLHRQLLYREADIGRLKVSVAAERLKEFNPELSVDTYDVALTVENAAALIGQYDLVLDGTDRFDARYAVNEGALATGKLNVFAAVHGFTGQLAVFGAENGPCYRCVFPEPPDQRSVPTCAEAGILGAMPGLLGAWQALEALKLILGLGSELIGAMLMVDGMTGHTQQVRISKNLQCSCAEKAPKTDQDRVELAPRMQVLTVSPQELQQELQSPKAPKLLDVREDDELAVSKLAYDYHIPLGALLDRVGELNPEEDLVVYCRSGARSANAAAFLMKRGFKRVRNLESGINGWARTVDPSVPLY